MHRTHARQSTSNQSFSHNQVAPCGDRRYDAAPGYVRGSMECLPLSTLAMSYHPVVCHSPNTLARRTARAVRIRGKATSCGLSGPFFDTMVYRDRYHGWTTDSLRTPCWTASGTRHLRRNDKDPERCEDLNRRQPVDTTNSSHAPSRTVTLAEQPIRRLASSTTPWDFYATTILPLLPSSCSQPPDMRRTAYSALYE